jgi:methylthioribose-1-phosphate isomerase
LVGCGSHFRHQRIATVRLVPAGSPVANHGFDVAPARLVSGLITERGCA